MSLQLSNTTSLLSKYPQYDTIIVPICNRPLLGYTKRDLLHHNSSFITLSRYTYNIPQQLCWSTINRLKLLYSIMHNHKIYITDVEALPIKKDYMPQQIILSAHIDKLIYKHDISGINLYLHLFTYQTTVQLLYINDFCYNLMRSIGYNTKYSYKTNDSSQCILDLTGKINVYQKYIKDTNVKELQQIFELDSDKAISTLINKGWV